MRRIPLYAMAHARSGDKGDGSNVGVLAYDAAGYEIIKRELTPERVKAHFAGIVLGVALVSAIFLFGQNWIAREFGLFVELNLLAPGPVYVLCAVALIGCLIGLVPGIRMYRYALIDGMTVRL